MPGMFDFVDYPHEYKYFFFSRDLCISKLKKKKKLPDIKRTLEATENKIGKLSICLEKKKNGAVSGTLE